MDKQFAIPEFLSSFKLPLVVGGIGIFLLLIASVLLLKSTTSSPDVVFTRESSASSTLTIHIDIAGGVMKPGVYELTFGSRVEDALVASGGLSAAADRDWIEKNLNRAAKLTDGGKIYIPKGGETSSSFSNVSHVSDVAGIATGRINLNTASQSELESLPGIGPVTAGKIMSSRPYQTIEELKTKKAVSQAVFEKIKDQIGL